MAKDPMQQNSEIKMLNEFKIRLGEMWAKRPAKIIDAYLVMEQFQVDLLKSDLSAKYKFAGIRESIDATTKRNWFRHDNHTYLRDME